MNKPKLSQILISVTVVASPFFAKAKVLSYEQNICEHLFVERTDLGEGSFVIKKGLSDLPVRNYRPGVIRMQDYFGRNSHIDLANLKGLSDEVDSRADHLDSFEETENRLEKFELSIMGSVSLDTPIMKNFDIFDDENTVKVSAVLAANRLALLDLATGQSIVMDVPTRDLVLNSQWISEKQVAVFTKGKFGIDELVLDISSGSVLSTRSILDVENSAASKVKRIDAETFIITNDRMIAHYYQQVSYLVKLGSPRIYELGSGVGSRNVLVSGDRVFVAQSGKADERARLVFIDRNTMREVRVAAHPRLNVDFIPLHSDGKILMTLTTDGEIQFWNSETGALKDYFHSRKGLDMTAIKRAGVKISSNGSMLIVPGKDIKGNAIIKFYKIAKK